MRRRSVGGAALILDRMVDPLETRGIELVIDEVEGWIPDATGPKIDREVREKMKAAVRGFDAALAVGYRTAWAVGSTFGLKFPWAYFAYDLPYTTHRLLIDHLNGSRAGLCSSRVVKRTLAQADALNLMVWTPGVLGEGYTLEQGDARAELGIPDDVPVAAFAGRFVRERSPDELVSAMQDVWYGLPDARLILSGEGSGLGVMEEMAAESDGRVTVLSGFETRWVAYAAADVVVVPSRKQGFSTVLGEAMGRGRAVLIREDSGLDEFVSEGVTGSVVGGFEGLGEVLARMLGREDRCAGMGDAARRRAEEMFDFEGCVDGLAEVLAEMVRRPVRRD